MVSLEVCFTTNWVDQRYISCITKTHNFCFLHMFNNTLFCS